MTNRDILLTGATGFVGSHVAEALVHAGLPVRALVRPTSRVDRLEALGVTPVVGRFDDPAALRRAVQGAEVVIHLAALTHARTAAELTRVNEGATRALVAAMQDATPGPVRLVYMSSLAAAGPAGAGNAPVRAGDAPRPLTAYGRSKLAGERVVQEATGWETVILRAPAVYGPRDAEMLRFFRMARFGLLAVPAGPARPLQLVHAHDLARAVLLAARTPGAAGVFHIAEARSYSWAEVCRLLGRIAGRRVRLLSVPGAAIRAAAAVSEAAAGVRGRSTIFNRDKAKELLAPGWLCETDEARARLGFEARIPLEQGLRETWEWYRNEGWL